MRKNYTSSLDKDIDIDVLIIGGGITGLTCAYFLKDSNLNIALIDKLHIGSGATGYTTGKLTYMQDLIYNKMKYDDAVLYLESQKEAIKIVKDIVKKHNIECNLEKTNAYVFTDEYEKIDNFKKEEYIYNKLNIKYKTGNKIPLTFPVKYSLKTNDSYVFHPLKYLYAIKKIILNSNIKIYENTMAINLKQENNYFIVKTKDNHIIKSKYVVMACGYPFFVNPYFIPFKTSVEKSYIVAGLVNKNKKFQAISNLKPVNSLRYYENKNKIYLLYSYGSHNITDHIDEEDNYKLGINKYRNIFNNEMKYYFLNQDVMTSDGLPLIGRINNSNLLISVGYNKWGMTNGTIGGKILSDIILNKENKYVNLFKLDRKISLKKINNLIIYNYSNAKRYVISKVKTNYKFYDNVKIVTRNGIKCGIYIDKNNKEHIVKNICPHLKCNLIFNMVDKTWDCPCHGSRFDKDGNVIFGPSVFDIKLGEEKK